MSLHRPAPLVEEMPLAIVINGISFSVLLVSPFDLDDFVYGYLQSESIIQSPLEIHDLDIEHQAETIIANVRLSNRSFEQFKHRQRLLKGSSGCGLCGTEALEFAFPSLPQLPDTKALDLNLFTGVKSQLRQWQTKAKQSGALHGAFWLNKQADVLLCREDIGRHNALDKLLGALAKNKTKTENGVILLTSRCSAELVQKTIIAGVRHLITLASPSTLAVKIAQKHNLHLFHIPKQDAPYTVTGNTQHD